VGAALLLSSNEFKDLSDPPLRVDYLVENDGGVRLQVFNVAGLEMRKVLDQSLTAGSYSAFWDGKDDTGAPLASGLYLVVLTEPGHMEIKKVVVLKQ
jgi:flagellar hook assembly protein FlgD